MKGSASMIQHWLELWRGALLDAAIECGAYIPGVDRIEDVWT